MLGRGGAWFDGGDDDDWWVVDDLVLKDEELFVESGIRISGIWLQSCVRRQVIEHPFLLFTEELPQDDQGEENVLG